MPDFARHLSFGHHSEYCLCHRRFAAAGLTYNTEYFAVVNRKCNIVQRVKAFFFAEQSLIAINYVKTFHLENAIGTLCRVRSGRGISFFRFSCGAQRAVPPLRVIFRSIITHDVSSLVWPL